MKQFFVLATCVACVVILSGCSKMSAESSSVSKERVVMARTDSIEVLSEVVVPNVDAFENDIVALWIKNLNTGKEEKLFETVKPDNFGWIMSDGDRFIPVSIDSIPVAQIIHILDGTGLRMIVEGCPDMRNIYSYLVDIPSRKAWYIPSNSGFMGETFEEGCLVFRSYRYMGGESGGRYTFIQVFDDGVMVDSLDLRHVITGKLPDIDSDVDDLDQ